MTKVSQFGLVFTNFGSQVGKIKIKLSKNGQFCFLAELVSSIFLKNRQLEKIFFFLKLKIFTFFSHFDILILLRITVLSDATTQFFLAKTGEN